jgi:hypothetical protein
MEHLWTRCEICNKDRILKKNFQRHCETSKHILKAQEVQKNEKPQEEVKEGVIGTDEQFGMSIENIEENEQFDGVNQDNDFMGLTNDTYISPEETEKRKKEEEKQQKERTKDLEMKMKQEKLESMASKKREKESKNPKGEVEDNGTEILGRERRELLKKINMYKSSFPKLLGKFRVKKNATVEELMACYDECDAIICTETIDSFVLDSVFQIIRVGEVISSKTHNYDISGLSAALKQNEQFVSLARQLYIKYTIFSAVPPEYQMVFIIVSTSYVIMQQNRVRKTQSP